MKVFLMKNHLFRYSVWSFCSKFDWGSYIVSATKTDSKISEAFIRSMIFFLCLRFIPLKLLADHARNTDVLSRLVLLINTSIYFEWVIEVGM